MTDSESRYPAALPKLGFCHSSYAAGTSMPAVHVPHTNIHKMPNVMKTCVRNLSKAEAGGLGSESTVPFATSTGFRCKDVSKSEKCNKGFTSSLRSPDKHLRKKGIKWLAARLGGEVLRSLRHAFAEVASFASVSFLQRELLGEMLGIGALRVAAGPALNGSAEVAQS